MNSVPTMKSPPSTYSQSFGERDGEPALRAVHDEGAERRADQRPTPADRRPDRHLDRVRRLELARVDDAHLRHVEGAGDATQNGRKRPRKELVAAWVVAEEHHAALRVTHGAEHAAGFAGHDRAAQEVAAEERDHGSHVEGPLGRGEGERVAVELLEVSEAVVPAEAGVVAEEQEHQRVGEGLRDDREVDATDARAEREVAEHVRAANPAPRARRTPRTRSDRSRAKTKAALSSPRTP